MTYTLFPDTAILGSCWSPGDEAVPARVSPKADRTLGGENVFPPSRLFEKYISASPDPVVPT